MNPFKEVMGKRWRWRKGNGELDYADSMSQDSEIEKMIWGWVRAGGASRTVDFALSSASLMFWTPLPYPLTSPVCILDNIGFERYGTDDNAIETRLLYT